MCGLVGVAGNVTSISDKIFRTLLILDTLRGEHSTGVAAIRKNTEEVYLAKQLGNPFELFNDKRYDTAVNSINKVLIGHNRFATRGAVNKANAHPFENDLVVGAHNGTLDNKYSLVDHNLFDTDSEALYNHIKEKGLSDLLSIMKGAWALTWWNKEEETLNLLRNSQRSLYLCYSKDESTVYWASEDWMLQQALLRNNTEHLPIQLLPVDTLFSIKIGKPGTLTKPHLSKAEGVKPNGTVIKGGKWFYKGSKTTQETSKQASTTQTTTTENKGRVGALGLSYDGSYVGKKNVKLELVKEFVDLHAARYISCLDPLNPTYKVRVYLPPGSEYYHFLGEHIIGDISGLVDNRAEGLYYKVSPHSVSLSIEEKEEETKLYQSHIAGVKYTKEDWKRRYKDCCFCASPLDPEEDNKFVGDAGEVLCQACSGDKVTMSYVKTIMNVD